MTHFRLRWQKLGGHVHVNVWSGTERETTHGRNGSLIFREEEWNDFVDVLHWDGRLSAPNVEVIPEATNLSDPDEIGTFKPFDDHSELY